MTDTDTDQEPGISLDEQGWPTDPLAWELPPDALVLAEARKLAGDKNVRVESLATACLQDPVIVIELLRTSNALYFSGGRSAITSAKTAIVRLGSDTLIETLDSLLQRRRLEDTQVVEYLEMFRSRSKRIGIVARLFAEALARTLSEDCQAAGCLFSVGEMLAVAHLQGVYIELAGAHQRSGVNYRLAQNHRFDVEIMGVEYLRRHGIPDALLFAIDRDGRSRTQDRALMKPLCMAASELVDSFDSNKWERLAPGKTFSPKSALRMLQMSDAQYLKIYERASEYLFSVKVIEERRRQEGYDAPIDVAPFEEAIEEVVDEPARQDLEDLNSEIQDLLQSPNENIEISPKSETTITEVEHEITSQFALRKDKKTSARKSGAVKIVAPPKSVSKNSTAFLSSVTAITEKAVSSEELLSDIMGILVNGPFEKAALIVISQDRKHALVVAARGPNIGNGQRIELLDPLSPLAQCFSKVQSFSSRANEASPFGSKAFAVAPIDADHETPVALYADCGKDGALTFEARRIFRNVVDILNQKLPSIPGGIPVELDQGSSSAP